MNKPQMIETKRTLRVLQCKIQEIHVRLGRMNDEVIFLLSKLAPPAPEPPEAAASIDGRVEELLIYFDEEVPV